MKQVNVLYLIRTWALGGSHTIIRLLLEHMPRDRYNIIVVPYDAPGDGDAAFVQSMRNAGFDVAPERIPWRHRGEWTAARAMIQALIEKYDIGLIHAHDTHSNVLVGIGRARWRCACVASPYGWWQPPFHFQAHLYHWIENHVALPKFDRVYTVSQDMKRRILRGGTPDGRIKVIHTGLDLSFLERGVSREATRNQLHIPHDAIVIGTVSRLFKEKGHKYLMLALKVLARDNPRLHLLIVGTGDQREPLEARAISLGLRDRVTFTGFYDDLPGALRAMDIFAQPSVLHEGFPTAVLEAQAAGLPVVATDIGGTRETMRDGVTGLLVPPRNGGALAAAIRTLAADPPLRARMAAAARPWIASSFTLDGMISAMDATYAEALDSWKQRGALT